MPYAIQVHKMSVQKWDFSYASRIHFVQERVRQSNLEYQCAELTLARGRCGNMCTFLVTLIPSWSISLSAEVCVYSFHLRQMEKLLWFLGEYGKRKHSFSLLISFVRWEKIEYFTITQKWLGGYHKKTYKQNTITSSGFPCKWHMVRCTTFNPFSLLLLPWLYVFSISCFFLFLKVLCYLCLFLRYTYAKSNAITEKNCFATGATK